MTTETEVPITDRDSAKSSWDAAMEAEAAIETEKPAEVVTETVKTEAAPVVQTNGTKPTETPEFPAEIVDGAKPLVTEDPDAVFKEVPKGPIKHENFLRVQKDALDRVTAAKAEAETLRAEIAQLKTATGTVPDEHVKATETLKAERDALLERLGQVDYARTPDFESKFTKREQGIATALVETAEAAGADKDIIASLLHVPLKRRMAMLDEAELNPSARGRIDALLVRYDEIQGEKGTELANWKVNATARQQAAAAQEQARTAAEERQYTDALSKVTKELFEQEPFRMVEGNEKWNAVATRNRANAEEIVRGSLSPEGVVRAAVHAAGYESLLGMFRQSQARCRDMAAELATYKQNSPVASNTSHTTETRKPKNDTESSQESWNIATRNQG